jgi:hypothetical protein
MEARGAHAPIDTAVSAYRACVLTMTKSLGPAHADDACAHLKGKLLRCIARDRCPSEFESVEALCGAVEAARGAGRRACAVAMASLDACLSSESADDENESPSSDDV